MKRRSIDFRRPWPVCFSLLMGVPVSPAAAVTHLRRGTAPPPVSLTTLDGTRFDLATQRDRLVLLLFGELYQPRTIEACRVVENVLADSRLAEARTTVVLIVAQQADAPTLLESASRQALTLPILHDRDRSVFAAYQVSVLPSAVVIDAQGRVVHALAGLSASFRDVITDALLLGVGRLSAAQFEHTLHPTSGPAETDVARRAARLSELGHQLARSNMSELAAAKFREALNVDSRCLAAHEGLGRLALRQRRLEEAEQHFSAALAIAPADGSARAGLAYIQILRGGAELPRAEQQVRALLAQRPGDPELHYLLGLIHDASGRAKEAAEDYRRASEILLERCGRE